MSKNYAALAGKVITALGGTGNIIAVTHCMTRLRFVLQDPPWWTAQRSRPLPGDLGWSAVITSAR